MIDSQMRFFPKYLNTIFTQTLNRHFYCLVNTFPGYQFCEFELAPANRCLIFGVFYYFGIPKILNFPETSI